MDLVYRRLYAKVIVKTLPLCKKNNGMLMQNVLYIFIDIHNKDLDAIIDLNSSKEIWERLELMHEGEISNNSAENEKRKRKKKSPYQKESVQINETSTYVNMSNSHEENI